VVRACKQMIQCYSTVLVTQPSHESILTRKNLRWLTQRACDSTRLVARQTWLGHITAFHGWGTHSAFPKRLFDAQLGPCQASLLRVRVDLGLTMA